MKSYIVYVREVHVQGYRVKAENEEQAKDEVREGKGDLLESYFEYSHTLDSDTWTVEEEKKDG